MKKEQIRDAILARLRADLDMQASAARLARDEAISEESRAENKYDTHSQEAAYLAEGQAKLAAEVQANIAFYSSFSLPTFAPGDPIASGALVELTGPDGGANTWYLLAPRAGGMELNLAGHPVLLITPQSPLGRALLGRRKGDRVQAPRLAPQSILSVQ